MLFIFNLISSLRHWRLTYFLHLLSGVAKKKSQDSILGNASSSYALQVLEGTTARIENTKHKIQIKRKAKDLKGSRFGVLLDLNSQFLNIYLDGELQTDISRPKGPTFRGLSGEMCAGLCLYGSKVEMSIVTGIATPLAPGINPVNYIWTERVPCTRDDKTILLTNNTPSDQSIFYDQMYG